MLLGRCGGKAGGLLKSAAERHVVKAFEGEIQKISKLGGKKPMVQAMELG